MKIDAKHPIYTANDYYRELFGEKLLKIAVDGGFTCPNRDGTLSDKGCIFCSAGGSGDFAAKPNEDIAVQIAEAKAKIAEKWKNGKYMVYFQAFTNTYAPVDILRQKYTAALEAAGAAALSAATRPDCINGKVVGLFKELSQKYYVTVEFGLQTSNEKTAEFINRRHKNDVYVNAVKMLNDAGIDVITHIILGLPGETREDMLKSVDFAVKAGTKGIKLQMLHILKGTRLAEIYADEPFETFEKDGYISLVTDIIERLPENIVVHRITGDAPKSLMIEPWWSLNKRSVLNGVSKEFAKRNSWQGKYKQ
ncbi:MAG: TIGR01212 family radical SAM protein [Firmicutes bacterium]|nr:TIGR01212 family radical SAM protein [Bacillota bacterium]